MPKVIEGKLSARGLRFALIVSRFNDLLTSRLLEGALDALRRHEGDEELIEIVKVPGSFELPVTAKKLALSGRYHAIICLGTIIRGATPHFEYIAAEAVKGIAQAALETGIPILLGVITADTLEQAIERAGTKAGNKGFDAAVAAIEMANLFAQLK